MVAGGVAIREKEAKEKEMEQGGRVITDLVEFIAAAERIGNYPTNTAGGIRAALRLVTGVLTDEEAASLDTFRNHLEQIFQRVFNKDKSRVSAVSLKVYRGRITSVLSDYEQYGRNPQAMASWKRKTRASTQRHRLPNASGQTNQLGGEKTLAQGDLIQAGPAMHRVEVSLRPNAKAILLVPADLSAAEVKKIKAFLDACLATQ